MPWGGCRHKSKPHVDAGLLFKEFDQHIHLLKDLGNYETASRTTSPDPVGLCKVLPLLSGLVSLEPSGEIHGSSLRNALSTLLTVKPEVNTSQYTGKVWANLRCERITTILNHLRTLRRDENQMKAAVLLLTAQLYNNLKSVVSKVKLLDEPPADAVAEVPVPLPIGDANDDVEDGDNGEHPLTRKLKAVPSACSVDSDGYPKMLNSPKKTDPAVAAVPRSFLRKRPGSLALEPTPSMSWDTEVSNVDLKGALGYEVLKRPAAKRSKAEPATNALPKAVSLVKDPLRDHDDAHDDAPDDASRTPWFKLKTTVAKKPARAYICGTHHPKEKVRLIVEITEKRSSKYMQIMEHILDALKNQHITKNEALEMRTELCLQFP